MKVGSLFAGIGGFDLGLEWAGFKTAWFCEQDPYCRRVLNTRWPGVPVYPDIRYLAGADVEPVEVLCGGFPCQDISLAGKGAGLDGERSGLWGEYRRLVGELGPRYVIVENVPALTRRGLDRVLGDLASLGYDAEWDCLPAEAAGAPHKRDRIWIVADARSKRHRAQREGARERAGHYARGPAEHDHVAGGAGQESVPAGGRNPGQDNRRGEHPAAAGQLADAERQGLEGQRPVPGEAEVTEPGHGGSPLAHAEEQRERAGLRTGQEGAQRGARPGDGGGDREWRDGPRGQRDEGWQPEAWWAAEPDVGRVADGIPHRVDRLRALGNALVPQIAEWIGLRILEAERRAGH